MNDRTESNAPLVLAKTGWVYAGGQVETIDGKQYTVGQIYAEYMIPAERRIPYPVIMVHGGTMSGTNYTGTPDGREGWAQNFVRAGYAVYVVDQVGKGRSAYYPERLRSESGRPTWRTTSRAMSRRRNSDHGRRRICTRNGRATARSTIRRCSSSSPRSFPRSRISTASKSSTSRRSSR